MHLPTAHDAHKGGVGGGHVTCDTSTIHPTGSNPESSLRLVRGIMGVSVELIPWLAGRCSIYAVVRNGICLADEFMRQLREHDPGSAQELSNFLANARTLSHVRESLLRPERPELGIFAMYNHREMPRTPYNPSRLLCSYLGNTNRILAVGSGFLKSRNEPIQSNLVANSEAMYLANVVRIVNTRIATGEIITHGSTLVPVFPDSLHL
jgi:hypothetical protein